MTNKFIYKNFTPNADEQLLKVARQSKGNLILGLVPAVIITIMPFFFLFPLFYWGTPGIAAFFLLLIIGTFWLTRSIIIWYFKSLIITNQRIVDIDQQKLFNRVVSDVPLIKIQDVFYRIKGLRQTMARVGDVQILLNDNKTKIEVNNIYQPQKVQQLILQLKMSNLQENLNETKLSAQELVNLVKKIKNGLGEERFNKIISEGTKPEDE